MANMERLTKRVKKMEEWVTNNEEMGGPKGYMDTFVHMYNTNLNMSNQMNMSTQQFQQLRGYTMEFIEEHKLGDEWNEFLKEKDNAVQKQKTEELPLQEETESSKEAVEESKEEE
jgi:hypothetical protein